MKVEILRQKFPHDTPYKECFDYNGPMEGTVASLIDYLNYNDDMYNDKGEPTERIGWECSCLQGVCGGCAMVINGVPALACETFLKDLKGDKITLAPLSKFMVIRDLLVDRSIIEKNLKEMNIYIDDYKWSGNKEHKFQYLAAKCLKCGLCLEVCPNYTTGEKFYGAVYANDCYLVATRNKEKMKEVKKSYKEHMGKGCSKALSCSSVCPMGISLVHEMGIMNR